MLTELFVFSEPTSISALNLVWYLAQIAENHRFHVFNESSLVVMAQGMCRQHLQRLCAKEKTMGSSYYGLFSVYIMIWAAQSKLGLGGGLEASSMIF